MHRTGTARSAGSFPGLAALVLLVAGLLWALPVPASAHYVGPTIVVVAGAASDDRSALTLDVDVPLQNLDFAYGTALDADPVKAVAQREPWLRTLIADRVGLTSPDGGTWAVKIGSLAGAVASPDNLLRVRLTALAPPGTWPGSVDLRWAVVSDVVRSDKAYVSNTGSDEVVELAGVLTSQQPTLRLAVQPAPSHVSFATMLRVGADHFRAGVDHQLFLCLLALGAACRRAPLLLRLRQLGLLTLCFTLGHSVSLALATAGGIDLPSRWVETCIAVTIVLAAIHAVRPRLGASRKLRLTVAFGLVHGFGFAGTLNEMSLRGTELAVPLLGFNLGLELAQLAALALIALPVWLVTRSRPTTWAVTGVIAVVAASWVVQRALSVANPLDRVVSAVLASPEWLALVLLVAALPHLLYGLVRRSAPRRRSMRAQPVHSRPKDRSSRFLP